MACPKEEVLCQCHSQRRSATCPLDEHCAMQSVLGRSCAVLEVEVNRVEEFVSRFVKCKSCKDEALSTLSNLVTLPNLCLPVELDIEGSPGLYSLKAEPNLGKHKLIATSIRDVYQIPAVPYSVVLDQIYTFLNTQCDGGLFSKDVTDENLQNYIQELGEVCTNRTAAIGDEQAVTLALQIDYLFDALTVGYYYQRLFRPESMPTDLVFLVNSHRRDQADFFVHLVAQLRSLSSPTESRGFVLAKLVRCFRQSLQIFLHPNTFEALRTGVRLFNPKNPDSFVYRHLGQVFPLHMMTRFLIAVKNGKPLAQEASNLSSDVKMMVRGFLSADNLLQFEADGEVLGHFSGGILSAEQRRFLVDEANLVSILQRDVNSVTNRRLVNRNEVGSWFGICSLRETVLEEASYRFWENRVSEYRNATRGLLQAFADARPRLDENVWDTVKDDLDSLFSVKIGLYAYGELDFILGRCYSVRLCKYPLESTAINRTLSHVISSVARVHGVVRPQPRVHGSTSSRLRMGSAFGSGMDDGPQPSLLKAYEDPSSMYGSSPRRRFNSRGMRASADDYSQFDSMEDDDSASMTNSPMPQHRWMSQLSTSAETMRRMSQSPTMSAKSHLAFAKDTNSNPGGGMDPTSVIRQSLSALDIKSSDDDWDLQGIGKRRNSGRKEPLTQFQETWSSKTSCLVRIPAAFFQLATENGALQDISDKTGVRIEIVRMGKILVAASAFRFEAAYRDAVVTAVNMFRNLIMNLGLCEKRFKVSKKVAARVVGKGGERVAFLRSKSNCKIFISDVEEDEEEAHRLSWIILLGKPDTVAEAHRLLKPYLAEQPFGPRALQPRSSNPAMASWSSISDDEMVSRLGHSARSSIIKASYNSEGDMTDAGSSLISAHGVGDADEVKAGDDHDKRKTRTIRDSPSDGSKQAEDALFKIIQHRDWTLAADLIARKEGIHFVAPSGTSVLHKAAERNAPEALIQALLDHGLDPNHVVVKKGYNSLHYAVQSNSASTLLLTLIRAGGNVNHQDENGFAPLHLAAQRNVSPKLVEVLLQNGANTQLKDKTGATPYEVGVASNAATELLNLLQCSS